MFMRRARLKTPLSVFRRNGYATRSEFERPKGFDINFKPYRAPFFSWKLTLGFGLVGAYLAYSEVIFEKYAQITEVDPSELLPIQLEFQLKTLPIYQKLTKTKFGDDWVMMKSYENLDRNVLESSGENGVFVKTDKNGKLVKNEAEYAAQSLTSHTLAQPGGIAITPVIFHNRKTDETITIVHMGYRLCGFPFVVHGGMLVTLLNETFKRNASLGIHAKEESSFLKDDYKVENLSISYRQPAFANQFFVVKTERVGRDEKEPNSPILYKSVIETAKGDVLVEAKASLQNTGRASLRLNQDKQSKRWSLF